MYINIYIPMSTLSVRQDITNHALLRHSTRKKCRKVRETPQIKKSPIFLAVNRMLYRPKVVCNRKLNKRAETTLG